MRHLRKMTWGLVLTVIVCLLAWVVVRILGGIYGIRGWMTLAALGLFAVAMALLLLEEFFRPLNPYQSTHSLYGLMEVHQTGEMKSGSVNLF